VLVKFINHLRVFLLLCQFTLGHLLYVSLVDVHEPLDFIGIVLLLHRVLNVLHEVLDRMLVFFSYNLSFFAL